MTDLEMTKLCAQAMEFASIMTEPRQRLLSDSAVWVSNRAASADHSAYDPLHHDWQVMALVKKFALPILPLIDGTTHEGWVVGDITPTYPETSATNGDLNRAIVECVARMQSAKKAA